jgi:tRNA uridine 5-carboxymethylaminomethyl modification enzyme
VVLTAGTFLDGRIHVGLQNYSAGRAGDPPAVSLSARLKELKLPQGRLKTGTPPRLDGRSIDFRAWLQEQPGDADPVPVFSFLGRPEQHPRQLPCWITHTNERTHEIIRSGFDRSPMFTGVIEGVGPRYCPSIEDKINRFADKGSHQIFLEPEGLTTHEFYPNGISTSLPFDIQIAAVRSMVRAGARAHPAPGLRHRVRLLRSRELRPSFETRAIGACSSPARSTAPRATRKPRRKACTPAPMRAAGARPRTLAAGAARGLSGRAGRRSGHKGVTEPYRMFTSRAEYRLQLREDNADLRLTETGRRLGLVDDLRWDAFSRKRDRLAAELDRLRATWVRPQTVPAADAERCWARRWSTSTTWPSCCADRGWITTWSASWPRSPGPTALFHVKHCAATGARARPMRSSNKPRSR